MEALPVTQPIRDEPATEQKKDDVNIIVLKFADAAIPVFKESKNRDFIKYGEDNQYPQYLTYLFNKSAKHNAIVNGKSFYVFGQGFFNGDFTVNRFGESLNDVTKKAVLDTQLYGGFRFEVIYNANGLITEIYHVDYNTIRIDKNGGYLYSEEWDIYTKDGIEIPDFNPKKPKGTQIFSYNEYRPNTKYYPLPDYIGSNNYIETDIEISKFYLSAIRNGMMPSKMVQFFNGEPSEDKKKEIERRFKNKFAGSENSGSIILAFHSDPTKAAQVTDLSATDLDKLFIELNKTCQQEIFSGHLVTSPMLFGIKTEGQLGGNTELRTAYELFNNTYAKPKADAISKEITYLLSYSVWGGTYELESTEPVGLQIDIKDVLDLVPKTFILEKLGIPEDMWEEPTAGGPTINPITTPAPDSAVTTPAIVNENIKNLSGRQQQQLERIIRKYKRKQLEEAAARMLLKSGLGLTDEEINTLLGIKTTPFRAGAQDLTLEETIAIFDQYGDVKDDYIIIKSKKVGFALQDIEQDEKIYIEEAFKEVADLTATEAKIIALIKKDPLITPEVIARTIGQSTALVENKMDSLAKRGYLETEMVASGEDMIAKHTIPDEWIFPKAEIAKKPLTKISIKYSYEGPQDSRNRPFCAKILELNRLYTRADIEKMSARLGYSVFDRRGGFWMHSDGTVTPYCRHRWQSNIVVQKQ